MINQIDKKLLQQAITVLRELNKKHYGSSKKKPLLEDEQEPVLYLQFSLKKIPKFKSIKMIKIHLPHSLTKDNSEVCLITGDLDKRNRKAEIEPDVLHYKELLKKHGIDKISEVITLRQLRTEYKQYEAKQKLLAAYDVFLADRKIAECLPKVLGRHFFKKRKFPIQITLNTSNLKQQVENALSTKVFYLTGLGNSCNSDVAYLDMSDTDISENVVAVANAFCEKLPGSWDNVMGIYLKTSLSKAVPVYVSYDDPNKVHFDEEKDDETFEIDDLSTCPNKRVKVYKDGRVYTVPAKKKPEPKISETPDTDSDSENKREKMVDSVSKIKKEKLVDSDSKNKKEKIVNSDSKNKKEKKKKVTLSNDYSLTNTDFDETTDVCRNSENKKVKRKKVTGDNVNNLTITDSFEDFPKTKAKSKRVKRTGSMLEQKSAMSIGKKEKQKKRKTTVKNV